MIVRVQIIETGGEEDILVVCREVFCLPKYVNLTDQIWKQMVDVKHCSGQDMPQQVSECNRFPCPHYWEELGWSACSNTCGIGVKTLKVRSSMRGGEEEIVK